MNLCGPSSSWWWSCTHKTYFQVFLSLLWLLVEIVWHFIVELVISTQFIVMVGIIWYLNRKLRRATNGPAMQQSQRQETHVLVQGPCAFSNNKQAMPNSNPSQQGPQHNVHIVQTELPAKSNSLSKTISSSNYARAYSVDRSYNHVAFEEPLEDRRSRFSLQTQNHFDDEDLDVDHATKRRRRQSLGARPLIHTQAWDRSPGQRLIRREPIVDFAPITVKQNPSTEPSQVTFQPSHSHPTTSSNSTIQDIVHAINANTSGHVNYPAPPKYNKTMNIGDWIREMDLYIDLNGIRGKKHKVFFAFLEDSIRKILRNNEYDDDDEIALEQLKEHLNTLFSKIKKTPLELQKEFNERRQNHGENVRIYGMDLTRLCKKAFPHCLNIEEYVIEQFIAGVINDKLKHELLTNRPTTVLNMIEVATKFENAHMKIKRNKENNSNNRIDENSKRSPPLGHINNQQTKQQNNVPANPTHGNLNSSHIGNYNRNPAINDNNSRFNTFNVRPQASTSQQDPRLCFTCNSPDHLKVNCPTRQTASTSAASSTQQITQTNHV